MLAAAGAPSGRGFFVPVVSVYEAPPPPLRVLSGVLGRAQVQVNVRPAGGWRRGEVVVPGRARIRRQRGDQARWATAGGVRGRDRRSTLITAAGGGGQAVRLWWDRGGDTIRDPLLT